MVSTTAPIAGKLATSHSRILVATEPKRVKLQFDADPRFAAAAGGAVRYLAEAAGMPEDGCRDFQQATIKACLDSFKSAMNGHVVELLRFEDHLEVTVDSRRVMPST
jgi:hypothetical protein